MAEPVIADGTVYVGTGDNHLYALDASSGQLSWRYSHGGSPVDEVRADLTPVVVDGIVYVSSLSLRLHTVNAQDGSALWNYEVDGKNYSRPSVAEGLVYWGVDSSLYAVATAPEYLLATPEPIAAGEPAATSTPWAIGAQSRA